MPYTESAPSASGRTSPARASASGASPVGAGISRTRRSSRNSRAPHVGFGPARRTPVPPGDDAQPRGQTRVRPRWSPPGAPRCAAPPRSRRRRPGCAHRDQPGAGRRALGARRSRRSTWPAASSRPPRRLPDTRILALDTAAQTITLSRTPDTELPGRYGLVHERHGELRQARLGARREDETRVKRKLLTHVGADAHALAAMRRSAAGTTTAPSSCTCRSPPS